MKNEGDWAGDIHRLALLFLPHCEDRGTLSEIDAMALTEDEWHLAHDLFQRIRSKHLVAERAGRRIEVAQYRFEEVCAKTLYNLSGSAAPFDKESPLLVHPRALEFAVALNNPDVHAEVESLNLRHR